MRVVHDEEETVISASSIATERLKFSKVCKLTLERRCLKMILTVTESCNLAVVWFSALTNRNLAVGREESWLLAIEAKLGLSCYNYELFQMHS